MDTAEALRQGRDAIESGWFKGYHTWNCGRSEGGPSYRCAWLAITGHEEAIAVLDRVVCDNWMERVQEGIQRNSENYVDEGTDPDAIDHLIFFNNHPDTTRDEVLLAYDKAIVQAEELI